MKLQVSEIFYSIQGEGRRVGEPSIFIRLKGCKAKHACWSMGIKCDTEFESGTEIEIQDLALKIADFPCRCIVWTGGEPTDQLTPEIVLYFKNLGYFQCIETSGLRSVPFGIDFVSVSPKVAEHVIEKNFPEGVNELRYVRHKGQSVPEPSIKADYYYLSPHSDGFEINIDNLKHCINLCLQNPKWSLSVQSHKLVNVL